MGTYADPESPLAPNSASRRCLLWGPAVGASGWCADSPANPTVGSQALIAVQTPREHDGVLPVQAEHVWPLLRWPEHRPVARRWPGSSPEGRRPRRAGAVVRSCSFPLHVFRSGRMSCVRGRPISRRSPTAHAAPRLHVLMARTLHRPKLDAAVHCDQRPGVGHWYQRKPRRSLCLHAPPTIGYKGRPLTPIVASETAGPVFGGPVFGAALAGVVAVVGLLVGSIHVGFIVAGVLAVVAIISVLTATGAYVDYARESVLVWRGGFPRLTGSASPFARSSTLNSMNTATAGSPDPNVSVDPKLFGFIDLIGPVRIQLAQTEIVGCEEQARAIARRLRIPLRVPNGAVETPHQEALQAATNRKGTALSGPRVVSERHDEEVPTRSCRPLRARPGAVAGPRVAGA